MDTMLWYVKFLTNIFLRVTVFVQKYSFLPAKLCYHYAFLLHAASDKVPKDNIHQV